MCIRDRSKGTYKRFMNIIHRYYVYVEVEPIWLMNIKNTHCLVYKKYVQGEIKLPVIMEDESHREIPSIHHFYRPVRQMVYAILFNLHHHTYMATKNKDKSGMLLFFTS